MKTKTNSILLGSALLLATVSFSWAEPSPDLMNSVSSMRLQGAKTSESRAIGVKAKPDWGNCLSWSRTRIITAGQNTVAVPDLSRNCKA